MCLVSFIICQKQDHASAPTVGLDWRVVYFSLTSTTNLVSTALIIFRIIYTTGIARSKAYRGIIKILVESCLVYSVAHLVYLVMFVTEYRDPHLNTSYAYASALLPAATVSIQHASNESVQS